MYIIINEESVVCGNSKEYSDNLPEGLSIIPFDKDTYLEPKEGKQVIYKDNRFQYQEIPKSYSDLRIEEYPDIAEQLDMLYHDMKTGTSSFIDSIQSIKNKHPKS